MKTYGKLLLLATCILFLSTLTRQAEAVTYTYQLQGLFDESTGDSLGTGVNVTAWFTDNSTDTFEVDGFVTYRPSSKPTHFVFELGIRDREYWLANVDNASIIEIHNQTLTTYTVQFLDLAGILDDYPYISFQRSIAGRTVTLEKRKVDAEKKVVVNLMYGKKYTISIEDGGTGYTYGEVLFESDTSETLTLKGIEFPQNVILGYRYNRIYAYRHNNQSSISVLYEDTKGDIANVYVDIQFANGSSVSGSYPYPYLGTTMFNHTYTDAVFNVTYQVEVHAVHSEYGDLYYNIRFERGWNIDSPWDFPLGTIPGFSMVNLVPVACIVAGVVIFSKINAPMGALVGSAMATMLYWWGWTVPADHSAYIGLLVTGLVFSILYGVVHHQTKGRYV